MRNKEYNLRIAKWTGNRDIHGFRVMTDFLHVSSNDYDYVWKKVKQKYSDIDIATGKIYFEDKDMRYGDWKPMEKFARRIKLGG